MKTFTLVGVAFGAILSVAIGAIIALALYATIVYDSSDVKRIVARLASVSMGREVSINGDLHIDPGWNTSIEINDLVIDNASWAKDANLAEIGSIAFSIDLRALIKGNIVLNTINIARPNIWLEKDADGRANWQRMSPTDSPEQRSKVPVIKRLNIEKGIILYRTVTQNSTLEINDLEVMDDSVAQRVHLKGSGALDKQAVSLEANGGSFSSLRDGQQPYSIEMNAKLADFTARVDGTLSDPTDISGFDLDLDISGQDLATLAPFLNNKVPATPPFSLSGKLIYTEKTWKFSNFKGQLGDSDLSGMFAADFSGKRPRVSGDFLFEKLNLDDLGGLIGAPVKDDEEQDTSKKTFEEEEQIPASNERVLPDRPLAFSRVNGVDAKITIKGQRIISSELPLDKLDLTIQLEDGTLRLSPVAFNIGEGEVVLYMSLYGNKTPPAVDLEAHVKSVDLKQLLRGSAFVQESAGLFGGQAKLSAKGDTIAQILGSANGDVFLVMTNGQISHLLVELAGLDIAESLGVAIKGDEPVPIDCIVGDFKAEDGILHSQTLVFDTTDSVIFGTGTINMRDEKLDLKLTDHPKDFSPLSIRTPIDIQGTFKDPNLFPDPVGIGSKTTVKKIINAVLTPILGLLTPIDTGVGKDSNCHQMIERAKQATTSSP